jgi:hypothetical protein
VATHPVDDGHHRRGESRLFLQIHKSCHDMESTATMRLHHCKPPFIEQLDFETAVTWTRN